jgi:DDE family transposase
MEHSGAGIGSDQDGPEETFRISELCPPNRLRTVRQYLVELEQQNPIEGPTRQQDQVSTTDPDSTYATKGGTPARLGYYDNYLVDNDSCVIVGVQATAARMSQETVAAQDMLARFAQWQGREPESVAADTTYANGEFLQWLPDRSVTPYMRTRDSIHRKRRRNQRWVLKKSRRLAGGDSAEAC